MFWTQNTAGSRLAAKQALERFAGTWKAIYPDAVACVEKDFDALIAFLEFPENEWMSLRTTNGIERLNKEFKKTIIMVTHDPHAAERASHVYHLEKGTFVAA